MFTGGDLIHRNAQGPNVCACVVPLELQDFGCPIHHSVWHSFLDQHSAKVLVRVSGSIELHLAQFAEHRRIVRLDED